MKDWRDRCHGGSSYRATQVLTGHGCFGSYLRRVGKEATARCHHCPDGRGEQREDSARHTLLECAAWTEERGALRGAIGVEEEDLSLPAIVAAIVRDEGSWNAMVSFCEAVISRKEAAERERERGCSGSGSPPGQPGARGGQATPCPATFGPGSGRWSPRGSHHVEEKEGESGPTPEPSPPLHRTGGGLPIEQMRVKGRPRRHPRAHLCARCIAPAPRSVGPARRTGVRAPLFSA